MDSSKDKEALRKHLLTAIQMIEMETSESEKVSYESTIANGGHFSRLQSTKGESAMETDEDLLHYRSEAVLEAEFMECIEKIDKLQNSLDVISESFQSFVLNHIGANAVEDHVVRHPQEGLELTKRLDSTDGISGEDSNPTLAIDEQEAAKCDYEDMEDHTRETEIERQNDVEKSKCLCAEEYHKAKEESDLYKRKPIPDSNTTEEIPKEIIADEPQYWNFNEVDWKKRVAFEKTLVGAECKKFGQ